MIIMTVPSLHNLLVQTYHRSLTTTTTIISRVSFLLLFYAAGFFFVLSLFFSSFRIISTHTHNSFDA